MKNKILAIDSNIFIYHFEANPLYVPFTARVFQKILSSSFYGLTSIISLIEALSFPAPQELLDSIEESFKTLPNFTLCDVTEDIGVEAARIRREYGFRLPDSIQLATGLVKKANFFITNDTRLQNFKELKVVLLKNFSTLLD